MALIMVNSHIIQYNICACKKQKTLKTRGYKVEMIPYGVGSLSAKGLPRPNGAPRNFVGQSQGIQVITSNEVKITTEVANYLPIY